MCFWRIRKIRSALSLWYVFSVMANYKLLEKHYRVFTFRFLYWGYYLNLTYDTTVWSCIISLGTKNKCNMKFKTVRETNHLYKQAYKIPKMCCGTDTAIAAEKIKTIYIVQLTYIVRMQKCDIAFLSFDLCIDLRLL